jgi:hypothetical protein
MFKKAPDVWAIVTIDFIITACLTLVWLALTVPKTYFRLLCGSRLGNSGYGLHHTA